MTGRPFAMCTLEQGLCRRPMPPEIKDFRLREVFRRRLRSKTMTRAFNNWDFGGKGSFHGVQRLGQNDELLPMGLTRFRGHLTKGGYDAKYGREEEREAVSEAVS